MSLIKEFKEFISKGNVFDMAVGIIIGAAFGKIVSSLVNNVFMPPIGLLLGGTDFSKFNVLLKEAADGKEPVVLQYGLFIGTMVEFLIVSAAVFSLIKIINKFKRESQPPPPPPPKQDPNTVLLTEIRDLLKK